MDNDQVEPAARAKADLVTAIVLAALGLAVVYLSWTMPRLEARHIHPSTIPGLVPFALGIALTLCATLLGVRALRLAGAGGWQRLRAVLTGTEARRSLIALALVLVYALVFVGWLPFWLASMLFIFAFIAVFDLALSSGEGGTVRKLAWALVIAVVAGAGISYVFESMFLVRLP